ncbi:polysaccharide deacetylase family protein [Rhizobium sp. TH2]|uniref:polysaccharide deacetylase family protein n=1 Tax=Rhizobium sp. TH2 TaxID=2775403 RepID=UPI0021574221|nr:polysaccharide deacetylase family protein [Rhizobium sp. TH2]UVC11643.1 polysaccharide deacetylase family protein [Rhizobium sp. TH2]
MNSHLSGKLKVLAGRAWRKLGLPQPQRPAILMYHRIAIAAGDPWDLCVSPDNFTSQLQALKRRRCVLSLPEFAARHADGSLPGNAVAITFDDGYACNAEIAAPLLVEAGLPATIFLCTGMIDASRWFWWDALEEIVMTHAGSTLQLDAETEPVQLGPIDASEVRRRWRAFITQPTARQAAYIALWSRLKFMSEPDRQAAMISLHTQSGVSANAPVAARSMSLTQTRVLASRPGIEIGAHTVTHPALGEISSDAQRLEITTSKVACEGMIGRPVVSFAYPYGSHTAETARLVREAGLMQACTTIAEPVSATSDRSTLPRYQVLDWSGDVLVRKLGL